jgi:hypothetical protein
MNSKKRSKIILCLILSFTTFPSFGKGQFIQTIYPTRDTFVSDAFPNENYGTHPWLWVSNWENISSGMCQSYIYFILPPNYPAYKSIHLRFYIILLDTLHTFNISFYRINQNWDEMTLNWTGKPSLGDCILSKDVESHETYVIDIQRILTSRIFSIGIVAEDSRLNFGEIASKEHELVTSDQKLAIVLNNEETVIILSVVGGVVAVGVGIAWFLRKKRKKERNYT